MKPKRLVSILYRAFTQSSNINTDSPVGHQTTTAISAQHTRTEWDQKPSNNTRTIANSSYRINQHLLTRVANTISNRPSTAVTRQLILRRT
jgi:hypothetical protein